MISDSVRMGQKASKSVKSKLALPVSYRRVFTSLDSLYNTSHIDAITYRCCDSSPQYGPFGQPLTGRHFLCLFQPSFAAQITVYFTRSTADEGSRTRARMPTVKGGRVKGGGIGRGLNLSTPGF